MLWRYDVAIGPNEIKIKAKLLGDCSLKNGIAPKIPYKKWYVIIVETTPQNIYLYKSTSFVTFNAIFPMPIIKVDQYI